MTVKTANEIRAMEKSCRIAADALSYIEKFIRPGVSTHDLDSVVDDFLKSKGARSACLGYQGYPRAICTSINDIICHGVPNETTILKNGDIINVDITALYKGFHGDTSAMFQVGTVSENSKKLIQCAEHAMMSGIEEVLEFNHTGDIGFAIESCVRRYGFFAVKEIGGHGIGRGFHEEPFVPSFGRPKEGAPLKKWGTLTVEPMVNMTSTGIVEEEIKDSAIRIYRTGDGLPSAQFEHTVLITDAKPVILTLRN